MTDQTQLSFRALADPTRREILGLLRARDMTIAEVSSHFDITRAAIKKHLTVLSDGGFVIATPRGRETVNRLDPEGFGPVVDWFDHFDSFWDDRLATLKTIIEGTST